MRLAVEVVVVLGCYGSGVVVGLLAREYVEDWVIARRAAHYDHVPRRRWRYEAFEFAASLLGRDSLPDSRTD